jgi:hypothetical protein
VVLSGYNTKITIKRGENVPNKKLAIVQENLARYRPKSKYLKSGEESQKLSGKSPAESNI